MSLSVAERNAATINCLATKEYLGQRRFVLLGSLSRAAILGVDIARLADPKGRRFTDIDAVDRAGVLTSRYDFGCSNLDMQLTKTIRPLPDGANEWGLFDMHETEIEKPIATFSEESLGLRTIQFSDEYPDQTITVPSVAASIELAHLHKYGGILDKHADQLVALHLCNDSSVNPDLTEALKEYNDVMAERHARSTYQRARRAIYNAFPRLALSIREGHIGDAIRHTRGFDDTMQIPVQLSDEALSRPDATVTLAR